MVDGGGIYVVCQQAQRSDCVIFFHIQQVALIKADPCDIILHVVLLDQIVQCFDLTFCHGNFHFYIRVQMIARAERDKFLERCNLGAFVPRPSVGGIALVAEIKVLQLPVCEVGHLA